MLVFGHRGFPSKVRTENTLEAFHEAVSQGVDGIEFDVRLSKDGEPVLTHDATFHRVAGDAHRVKELTMAELTALPLRHGGQVATLNEVTAHIHAPTILDIEVKSVDALPAIITKLKTSASLRERAIITSFKMSVLSHVQRELPDVRTLLLLARWPLPLRLKKFMQKIEIMKPWGIGLRILQCTKRRVRFMQHHGFKFAGWDERGSLREARRAVALGVDIAILRRMPPSDSTDVN